MMKNQLLRQTQATVWLSNRRTGRIGSPATFSSKTARANKSKAEIESEVRTSGCVQGEMLPPEATPTKNKTRVATSSAAPVKSMRSRFRRLAELGSFRFSTFEYTNTIEVRLNGNWTRKATLQSHMSLIYLPKTLRRPLPRPQKTLLGLDAGHFGGVVRDHWQELSIWC